MKKLLHRVALPALAFGLTLLTTAVVIAGAEPPTDKGAPSLLVLDGSNQSGALNLGGGSRLVIDQGNLAVNSSNGAAIANSASAIQVRHGDLNVVGGAVNLAKGTISPVPQTHAQPAADPFKHLKCPEADKVVSKEKMVIAGSSFVTLQPGFYLGGINVLGPGSVVTMKPGTYAISDGSFFVTTGKVTGQGVTILLCGAQPGHLFLGNQATVNLSAPTSGPCQDVLLVSRGEDHAGETGLAFNGAHAELKGLIYAPHNSVGVFQKAVVSLSRLVCRDLVMNTGAALEVTGDHSRR